MKRFCCLFAVFVVLLSLVSCKDGGDETNGEVYTVSVINEAGDAVAGAMVQVCSDEICHVPAVTDASGRAVFDLAKDSYKVLVLSAEGYTVPDEYFAFDGNSVTITLEALE